MVYQNNFVVAVKYNGEILREKNDFVSLPFGSEYSLFLKNLDSRKAVVKISIDGKSVIGNQELVVAPYGFTTLRGFLKGNKVNRKFKFIQKTKEIINHRGDKIDDGIIRVEITYEKKVEEIEYIYNNFMKPWIYDKINYRDIYKSQMTSYSLYDNSSIYNCSANMAQPNIDEGITVEGSDTNQDFTYTTTKKLEDQSSVIIIRLRGYTVNKKEIKKPITVKGKLECSSCGRKYKSNFIFCPNCGTRL